MGSKDRRIARVWKEIDEIFWKVWDPIGIKDAGAARDEYYGYIGGAFRLLENGATEEQIAGYLHQVETERMGLTGDIDHCKEVARQLLQINLKNT